MRCVWATDIHLNFVDEQQRFSFAETVLAEKPDVVLLGGDMGEADSVVSYLEELADWIRRPIYFVLGNHDFYKGSINAVRASIFGQTQRSEFLVWLNTAGVVPIGSDTTLVGHDSWADGRLGNYATSSVVLNDFVLISEFQPLAKPERLHLLEFLANEAAEHFAKVLPEAVKTSKSVLLLTHVPPFREACWHEGKISGDDYLPFFATEAVGDVLVSVMEANPTCQLTVLCGHTHGSGTVNILPNLEVITGGAEYFRPRMQRVIEIS